MKKLKDRLFTKVGLFDLFENHTRLYYSLFYFATSLAFFLVAYYTNQTPAAYDQYFWLGINFWTFLFVVEAILSFILAFLQVKVANPRKFSNRFRQFATFFGAGLIFMRGVNIWRLPIGTAAALVAPTWIAFIFLWVAPLLWYLPTKISEFKALRDRTDALERRLKALESEHE